MPSLVFNLPDKKQISGEFPEGTSLLEAARALDIAIEGACGGAMACATCHVIVSEEDFAYLSEPGEDEEEMLFLARDLKATSRLGCQLRLEKNMKQISVFVPASSLL